MNTRLRVALFIDAENVPPSHAAQIVEQARSLGRLTVARCYGNDDALRGWRLPMGLHQLLPVQTLVATGKQNTSDFALTVDAVSLLHRGLYDVAVLASSDADFAVLAHHLRENAKGVCAVGDGKKLKPNYRALFDQVFEFNAKPRKEPPAKEASPPPSPPPAKAGKANIPVADIVRLFREFTKNGRAVTVPAFARYLGNHMPRNYRRGYGTVANYLEKAGAFEISKDNHLQLKAE